MSDAPGNRGNRGNTTSIYVTGRRAAGAASGCRAVKRRRCVPPLPPSSPSSSSSSSSSSSVGPDRLEAVYPIFGAPLIRSDRSPFRVLNSFGVVSWNTQALLGSIWANHRRQSQKYSKFRSLIE
eukprot:7330462-Pyramimonas_sp.AAC.2